MVICLECHVSHVCSLTITVIMRLNWSCAQFSWHLPYSRGKPRKTSVSRPLQQIKYWSNWRYYVSCGRSIRIIRTSTRYSWRIDLVLHYLQQIFLNLIVQGQLQCMELLRQMKAVRPIIASNGVPTSKWRQPYYLSRQGGVGKKGGKDGE